MSTRSTRTAPEGFFEGPRARFQRGQTVTWGTPPNSGVVVDVTMLMAYAGAPERTFYVMQVPGGRDVLIHEDEMRA